MKTKILVADGSELVARVAGQLATRFGYDVTACVSSGSAAVSSAKVDMPDLALVDLHMGGETSGVELAAALLEAGARVVLLSALPTGRSNDLVNRLGAQGLLVKPFGTTEFHEVIESALRIPRLAERVIVRTAFGG